MNDAGKQESRSFITMSLTMLFINTSLIPLMMAAV